MSQINLGKVMITLGGEWNSSTSYQRLVAVSHNGNGYISITENTGVEPGTNDSIWMLIVEKGDRGLPGVTDANVTVNSTVGEPSASISVVDGVLTLVLSNVKGDQGVQGVSVASIVQTTTATEPGGINVITVTLTNGQTFNFQVKNGDAAGQVNADWNATSGKAEILNKPDLSQFITKTVNDLTNYYLKSQTYSKTEVEQLIAAITALRFVSVAVLPTASAATMNKIYLVPSSDPQQQNVKDEYFTTETTGVYDWEKFGSTAMSLDGYVTTEDLNTALASYVTSSAFNTALAAKQDTISDLAAIRSGAAAGATAYQKPNTGIPQSDLAASLVAIIQKTVANVSSNEDGAVVITLVNGDTYTIDLNHTHPDKQDLLVSGTNIKTVNNQSILGSGNLDVGANITVDSALSATSENPVQNKVVKSAVDAKQDTLVSGTNIKTINNTSLLGNGNVTIQSQAATVSVGTTTTGNAGTDASVTNSGTTSAAVLNFTIPRGENGRSAINALVNHTASETVVTGLAWDTAHVFPEMASLDFGIAAAPSDGYEHELVVIFDTPADITNFALAVPSSLLWGRLNLADFVEPSMRYRVMITSYDMIATYIGAELPSNI